MRRMDLDSIFRSYNYIHMYISRVYVCVSDRESVYDMEHTRLYYVIKPVII